MTVDKSAFEALQAAVARVEALMARVEARLQAEDIIRRTDRPLTQPERAEARRRASHLKVVP